MTKTLEPPRVMGLEPIDESCLRIRIEAKVAPGMHFDVKRMLHLLLVEGFRTPGPSGGTAGPSKVG